MEEATPAPLPLYILLSSSPLNFIFNLKPASHL